MQISLKHLWARPTQHSGAQNIPFRSDFAFQHLGQWEVLEEGLTLVGSLFGSAAEANPHQLALVSSWLCLVMVLTSQQPEQLLRMVSTPQHQISSEFSFHSIYAISQRQRDP